ncbi:MAG: hypothetical protein KKE79_07495 [Actinobacteria bacterium]|nr:hypothetical protein [Actinomycetota bacterium]MCG2796208.1 hypothetical protein [Actinomycetes bacterium]MBU4241441.1 hypothetical protein [Actinomycetota bacterium]MBU4301908.1 hypothetical protein [Actinomycetota bacterium]MBU4385636.1 hypothetical protein [Actinomycetota bacterium]
MRRLTARLITGTTSCAIAVTPRFLLAWTTRRWVAGAVRRGERKLAKGSCLKRVLSGAVTPLSVLVFEIGGKEVDVRLVPWLAWFRGSIYYRFLSRGQLLSISRRFSGKVSTRVLLPAGLSVPVGVTPGVAVEATGVVLEWLIDRFLVVL